MQLLLQRLLLITSLILLFTQNSYAQFYAPCDNCEVGIITYDPPLPPNGEAYPPGTEVIIQIEVNNFQNVYIDWIHGVWLQLGPGFEEEVQPYFFPLSCSGAGSWNYYTDPFISCNLGLEWTNGFAFDGSAGLGCGGLPNDGNPGNNYGDGANGAPDCRTFAWLATTANVDVTDCEDRGYYCYIETSGDYISGSWNAATNQAFYQGKCFPEIPDFELEVTGIGNGNFEIGTTLTDNIACALNFTWSVSDGTTSNETRLPYNPSLEYTLCVADQGCSETCVTTIQFPLVDLPPGIFAYPDDTLCYGDDFILFATGGNEIIFYSPQGDTIDPFDFFTLQTANELTAGTWGVDIYKDGFFQGYFELLITVAEEIVFTVNIDPDPAIAGQPVTLSITDSSLTDVFWVYDTLAINDSIFQFTPPTVGSYDLALTLVGQYNCRILEEYTLEVIGEVTISLEVVGGRKVCDTDPLELSVDGYEGGAYIFTSPDGTTYPSDSPNLSLPPAFDETYSGIWTVELIIDGMSIASAETPVSVETSITPTISLSGLINGEAVVGYPVTFTPGGFLPGAAYDWEIDGNTIFDDYPVYTFPEAGDYAVRLYGRQLRGCLGIYDTIIPVREADDDDDDDGPIIIGNGPIIIFPLGSPDPGWTVSPNPSKGLINITLFKEPTDSYSSFHLKVYDANGRPVLEKTIPPGITSLQYKLTGLTAGVYTLRGSRLNGNGRLTGVPLVSRLVLLP